MRAWEGRGKKEAWKHKFFGLCSVTVIEHPVAQSTVDSSVYVYIYFMHVH